MSTKRSMSDETSQYDEIPPQKLRFISSNKIYFIFDSVRNDKVFLLKHIKTLIINT